MYDADPRINAYGRDYDYEQAKTKVRYDLMREHNCTEDQALRIMLIAWSNNYNYPFAINAVINEGATGILYNERHSGDGTYIYTQAYVTNTGKLVSKEREVKTRYQQNCYKFGGFK
jgi:hypothetical protein